MSMKDYYRILEVSESASQEDIKKSYRRLAKQYHPDTHPGDKAAEDRFKAISEAYQVLGDEQKRQKYDQMRKYGGGTFNFNNGGFQGFPGFGGRQPGGGFSYENFDIFSNLGDLFTQFFDRGEQSRQQRHGPRRGDDTLVNLTIPFELAVNGGTTAFSVQKEKTCPVCEGGGAKPGSRVEVCPDCRGTGTIVLGQGGFGVSRPCPRCYGKGQIIKNPCNRCKGTGQVMGKQSYKVKIQPGTKGGDRIRLKGQGNPGIAGGSAGNMIVMIGVAPHRFFERIGHDIYCKVVLTLQQAVKGSTVLVRTISGKKAKLKIPPKTRNGKIFRLPGMGIKGKKVAGHQYVTIEVKIPEKPTPEQEAMLEEIERGNK